LYIRKFICEFFSLKIIISFQKSCGKIARKKKMERKKDEK